MLSKLLYRRALRWQSAASSETGPNKPLNEDCVLLNDTVELAIVCDGVGGHGNGDLASQLACKYLGDACSQQKPRDGEQLRQLIRQCHQHLLDHMQRSPDTAGMATTVVLALKTGNKIWMTWAGDSRAYLLRKGNLSQLTDDHSFVNEKVTQGILSREEAEHHPMAHLITSSLGGGINSLKRIGTRNLAIKPKDRLILCTDGVHAYMSEKAFEQAASQSAQTLVQQAIDNNTGDNCSAICIDML
ncbi:protein phosphatase 2C domain-containing protein [Alcanivorax sp.]|uniref:PP2C family protein-serine/threonine phosphatase n=1 Tax=Alcanivorax sp. TaxID=1872427 RepID=UPI00261D56F1|nr:protein phosphatase 2C domain-containing protein [Alcanivorax sp.]